MKNNRKRTFDLTTCAIFVALIIVGAFLRIPTPIVPITFQLVFCLLSAMLLGAKLSSLAMAIYMLMGLIGIPVFSSGGGIGYLLTPTFGYIVGFIFSAFVCGLIANPNKKPKFWKYLLGALVGFFISYAIGMLYYYLITTFYLHTPKDSWFIFQTFFLATAPKDLILAFLACLLAYKLAPILNKVRNLPNDKSSKNIKIKETQSENSSSETTFTTPPQVENNPTLMQTGFCDLSSETAASPQSQEENKAKN